MKIPISIKINGREYNVEVKSNELLLNVLREKFGLLGAKYGCGIGECGACTVLLNGRAILSCLTLAVSVNGQEITTIEGLSDGSKLHPLQESFIEEGAIQCGFCTPGMILSAKALIDEKPEPTNNEIKEAIRGNVCRCTGYVNIITAIKAGAKKIKRSEK
ncbi:MAG: (2Fe-2S)-binding protein [Spirochaetes bacterium]|nr:MAG: (2Fe-2S)-binding protein [Spirochaetota bacterium]